jgi:hypothetical protein
MTLSLRNRQDSWSLLESSGIPVVKAHGTPLVLQGTGQLERPNSIIDPDTLIPTGLCVILSVCV